MPSPDATHLLIALQGRGFRLRVDGDTLYVSPSDALTAGDRTAIRAHKPDLISLVRGEGDGLPFALQPDPEDGPAVAVWEGLPSLGVWRRVEPGETPAADLWPVLVDRQEAGRCRHPRKAFFRRQGKRITHVAEMCPDCGENVRGPGVWVSHRQAGSPEALPEWDSSAGVAGGTDAQPGGKSAKGKAKPAHGSSFFDS